MKPRASVLSSAARPPLTNYIILLLIACFFDTQMMLDPDAERMAGMVLQKWSIAGLLGHMWLHKTFVHVLGNLVTLWAFGYHVCAKVGSRAYVIGYVLAGTAAGVVHLAYDGRPVIGASGAIMGVLGMHTVICFRRLGRFGPWLILVWFLTTLGAGIVGGFPAAYMAHVGGFLGGMLLALCLVLCHVVDCDGTDPALSTVVKAISSKAT